MKRSASLAASAALLIASVVWASPVAAIDCNTEGGVYPDKGRTEGATFLGVATGRFRNDKQFWTYTFDVKKVYAGEVGSSVRVEIVCLDTRFRAGRTFLVSSGRFSPSDGSVIHHLRYDKNRSVSWRVFDDRSVRLIDDRPQKPPWYLRHPDTLSEAVAAVTSD